MKAFHNDPAIKAKYLARLRSHVAADEIIHGKYWEDGKGCAVGCTIHSSKHASYETELGIPQSIARLEDTIFEGLKNDKAKKFPLEFLESIPVGADLSRVTPLFLLAIQRRNLQRLKKQKDCEAVREAVQGVIALLTDWSRGVQDLNAARSAAESAESAARSAARRAAESAESAAESAWCAWSAEESARSAAESAWCAEESARSAARSAKKHKEFIWMGNTLLSLLKAA